jgi:hypothetical protein
MKKVLLNVEDSTIEAFLAGISICPSVSVMSIADDAAVMSVSDLRMAQAVRTLQQNGALRRTYDYAWLMAAINDGVVKIKGMGTFKSPQSFIDYLQRIGLGRVAGRTTISVAYGQVFGKFPDWQFIDTQDLHEILRRKNVVKQLISALNKG